MTTYLSDRREGGDRPAEVITTTLNGVTFRAGRRTAAHLAWTGDALRRGGHWLRVIQPCYNTGVTASAGTHDFDGCLDVEVMNADWGAGQTALRELGWAAWHRSPPTFTDHIHMVSLGCPGPVGIYVPAQVDDYYRHALGLKGQHDSGDDPSWHPADIDSTIFDYAEDIVTPDDIEKIAQRTAELVLAADVDKDGKVSVKQALNQIRNAVAKVAGK